MVHQAASPSHPGRRAMGCSRRGFLLAGLGSAAGVWLPACAAGREGRSAAPEGGPPAAFEQAAKPALAGLAALAGRDVQNGGEAPFPIPWLDKNGSFNQAPGPGQEPSNIFHFKGHVARANDFKGMGTDNRGRRIPFGTVTTDFSYMQGTYWAGRAERNGAFAHT